MLSKMTSPSSRLRELGSGVFRVRRFKWFFVSLLFLRASLASWAEEPLHARIDQLLEMAHPGGGTGVATDSDFLRRAYLVLSGVIPSAAQARAFLADPSPEKRARLVDELLGSREFIHWMAVRFDVMLMERRSERYVKVGPWHQFLEESFAVNKPWDELVREILSVDGTDEKTRAVARWCLEREGDPHALTKDAGRIFLGRDMGCAQCHDHPRIDDYSQRDYYGIEAFFSRTTLFQPDDKRPAVLAENAQGDASFTSVFTKVSGTTRPRLPDDVEIAEPALAPAELWVVAPNDKDKNLRPVPTFSRRTQLALIFGDGHHLAFRRNIANRLWYIVFGRGLVEPLDLQHSANPPTNPALLDLLAEAIGNMKFDMKAFIHELALTRAFQRSFDFPEASPALASAAEARLPALEQEARTLGEAAVSSEEMFAKSLQTMRQAQLATDALAVDVKKQDAAVADAKKAADTATAETKKTEEALTTKRDLQKSLIEAASKSNEAAAKAPEAQELAQAAKTFQTKAEQTSSEVITGEKDLATKKADADAKTQTLATAQQTAAVARAKVDDAKASLPGLQATLDAAAARKQSDRTKARYAARLVNEAKAVIVWVPAADADRIAQERATRAETEFAPARQTLERLSAEVTAAPAKIASLDTVANSAAAQINSTNEVIAQRRAAMTALGEACLKTADAAAKLPKDAEVQSAAATIKSKADAVAAEIAALEKTVAEAPAKAEAAARLGAEARAALEKATAELALVREKAQPLEAEAKLARAKLDEAAPQAARAREALSTAWTESFAASGVLPLTPEQLCWSVMQATGFLEQQRTQTAAEWDQKNPLSEADKANPAKQSVRMDAIANALREKLRPHEEQYVRSFGGAPGQPQTDFFATPEQALYFENAGVLRGWSGILSARLAALKEPAAIAEELYLSTLTRSPTEPEIGDITSTLAARPPEKKTEALTDLAWALVTSVEFRFVH